MATAALPSHRRRRLRVPHPSRRLLVVLTLLLLVLAAVGWFWGRNSSLVAVNTVKITGTQGPGAPEIDRVITAAARGMSTLDFDPQVVRAAVAAYPVVASVELKTAFPHTVTVVVHQRTPVGTIALGSQDVPVSKDGTLLTGTIAKGIPAISSQKPPVGGRLTDPDTLAEVRVLSGATAAQRAAITHIGVGEQGVEVQLQGKPVAYFGEGDAPRDQWAALEQVLADPSSAGARYVDVSVAERPAAGGFADTTSTDGSTLDDSSTG